MQKPVEGRPIIRPFLLLAAVALLPAAAPLPTVPAYRQFGCWLVACDNTRACVARGFDEVTHAQLDLTRFAGEAAPTLTLSAADPVDPNAIRLHGKPLPLSAPVWSNKDLSISTRNPAAIKAFVTAVRDGQAITLDAAPSKDEGSRSIPMNGFTAALLLIDAVQGWPGTRTPLIAAEGTELPPSVPPFPPAPIWVSPPVLSQAETEYLAKQAGRLRSPAFERSPHRLLKTARQAEVTFN